MTLIHAVRGFYLAVSLAVWAAATWRIHLRQRSGILANATLAAYALATAAAQAYAFSKPLTVGTIFIGAGVATGIVWLTALAVGRRRRLS